MSDYLIQSLIQTLNEQNERPVSVQVADPYTYVIYKERTVNNVNGFLVQRVTSITNSDVIEFGFLANNHTFDIKINNGALLTALGTVVFG
jgi:hypothetical protein